jgi:twitching motility protein PilT
MARLDSYLEELHRRGGERLTVAAGRPVTMTSGGEEHPLGSDAPDRRQVARLLEEILPPEDPLEEGRTEFTYEAPSGRVQVRAYVAGGTARILAVPIETGSAREAATGSAREAAPGPEPDDATRDGDRRPRAGPPTEEAADAGPEPASRAPAGADAEPSAREGEGSVEAGETSDDEPVLDAHDPEAPDIERLFRKMVDEGCSDLHVSAENPPLFRKDGEMVRLGDEEAYSAEETREMLLEIAPERNRREFEETNDTDFAYEIPGVARFRCNLFRDRRGIGGVFRQIPADIMTAEDLGLPRSMLELCELKKGLVVVTGPTGSGKSTTLAALIDHINRTRRAHIITIEDPIEFVHDNKRCLINQREVGVHTRGFKVALRAALREDPDIVLVGEMRDLETVEIALETAETGHLVFGTLHTNTAASTVDRIIDQFPADQQNQIRTMLSESLKGVIAQTLCRRKEGGRIAAMEILLATNAVSNLIREGKTFQIPSVMQTGSGAGMRTMNDALVELVRNDTVTPQEAYYNAVEKEEFRQTLDRHGFSLEEVPEPGG